MLKKKDLIKTKAFINGKWVAGRKTFEVTNPYDGSVIAKVADVGKLEAKQAVAAAEEAFVDWAARPAMERAKILEKLAGLIEGNGEDLAKLLTMEQGKPLVEAKDEVFGAAAALRWVAGEGCRIHGYTYCDPDGTRSSISVRQPIGVVAAITPWNFPFSIGLNSLSALAAGCTLVLKPAEDTPLTALAIAQLATEAGVPKGVLNVLPCKDPKDVGDVLTTHPAIRKISFTGSTEVGKMLLKNSASTVKKVTLELGGNCPFIVFEDADLDKAIEGAFGLKFYNAGQCCNGVNRFLVHDSVYDEFVKRCSHRAKKLTCGSGMKEVNLGPLINKRAKDKVEELVQDALENGAELVEGTPQKGLLCSPIILQNANPKMRIWKEEIFGPVIAIYRFKTEKQAIEMANDTRYGLAAYFYSECAHRVMRVSRALEAGTVGANTTNVWSFALPFGGWKESGLGREGGIVDSLNDFTEMKAISFGRGG